MDNNLQNKIISNVSCYTNQFVFNAGINLDLGLMISQIKDHKKVKAKPKK